MIGFFDGLFDSEGDGHDVQFSWPYVLGGIFGVFGFSFPKVAMLFFFFSVRVNFCREQCSSLLY